MTIQQILFQREFPRISHKILCDEYWFAFEPEYMCLHFLLHSFGEGCWLSRWNDTDVHDVSVPLLHRGDASAKNTMKNTWGEASPGGKQPPMRELRNSPAVSLKWYERYRMEWDNWYHLSENIGIIWPILSHNGHLSHFVIIFVILLLIIISWRGIRINCSTCRY